MTLSAEDLEFSPPSLELALLKRALVDLFDIRGELEPLVGERDQNCRITTATGERFILKVSGSLEDPAITDCQTRALLHLERTCAGDLAVPRVIPNRGGACRLDHHC